MKKNIVIIGLFALVFSAFSAVIPGKTFQLDFENANGQAEFALGSNAPKTEYLSQEATGYNGHKAYRVKPGAKPLTYSAYGNASAQQGTAIMWVNTVNYDLEKSDGHDWSIKPIRMFRIRFGGASWSQWVDLELLLYRGADAAGVRFTSDCSAGKQGFGSYPNVAVPLRKVAQGKWYQVCCTWDVDNIAIYLNGEFQDRCPVPRDKSAFIRNFQVQEKFGTEFTVRGSGDEQSIAQRKETTDVDDFSVYGRVLSPAEINYLYLSAQGQKVNAEDLPHVRFQGSFRNGKEFTRGIVDLTMLRTLHPDVFSAENELGYAVLNGEGEKILTGRLAFKEESQMDLLLSGLEKAGRYTLQLELGTAGAFVKCTRTFDKPDTSWVESQAGEEDVTPKPWTNPTVSEDNIVSVWNRKYSFGDGPFPRGIAAAGTEILAEAPQLLLDGKAPGVSKISKRIQKNSFVLLEGEIQWENAAADFVSRIDFDGFVQTDLTMKKTVLARNMQMKWKVAPECIEHLLLPRPASKGLNELGYYKDAKCIYFASEKGGFCWMPSGDDNWNYAPEEKVCLVDSNTGACELRIITQPVTVPAGAKYTFCFVATPTRPLMENARAWRFMGEGAPGDSRILYNLYEHGGNLLISPERVAKAAKGRVRSLQLYSASSFLSPDVPEAAWFFDEWLSFSYHYCMTEGIVMPSCINSSKANMLAENTRKSLDRPQFDMVEGYYFDCNGVGSCDNPMHGCGRVDMLGRQVKSTTLLPLRNYMKRIVRLLHSRDRILGGHGQLSFIPGVHGLCDYWFTGEDLRTLVMKEGTEVYCNTDKVTDEYLRSITNFRILCNVCVANAAYGSRQMPGITRMLLEDIKCSGWFNSSACYKRMDKVWKGFAAYKVDAGKVHRHFEQGVMLSSNPQIKVTWYECPDGSALLFACNLSGESQQGKLDFSAFRQGCSEIQDEIAGKPLAAENSTLEITVPPMDFLMLGIKR